MFCRDYNDSEDEFDQDLCMNLCHGLKKLLWQDELNPRVRCAFGNVLLIFGVSTCALYVLALIALIR